jgi:hypothetical protein
MMGHLVSADGVPVAVGDGLGVAWDQLQPGDVLVQRHVLAVPHGMPDGAYWLQAGGYWLDTMERWNVLVEHQVAGDRILATLSSTPR